MESTFLISYLDRLGILLGTIRCPSNDFRFLYCYHLISSYCNTFAIGAAVFMTEVSPKGAKILQPAIELLVGIPSVVYGFIGLQVVVPFVRTVFGGTGFGILSGIFVLFVMILPTVTFMTTDSLRAVPRHYREASLAMGATRWQTIWRVTLKAARSGIFTDSSLRNGRVPLVKPWLFRWLLVTQQLVPTSLTTPAATLTSV